ALVAGGAVASDPQEVALLAEPDPIRRAALEALVHARTERTASILLDQAEGALGRELAAALAALAAGDETVAANRLDELLRHARLGGRLVEPFRVVLVGAPNAGKSSLVNALMGFQRSIVHAQPGTTRDLVTATTALEGWPVELIDTAGLREADDPLEQAGIARAVDQSHGADLVLLVIDRSRNDALPAFANRAGWAELVVVHNKCDLPPGGRERDPSSAGLPCCLTSAATGEGIERLLQMIAARLVPQPPLPGAAVPFTATQVAHLQQARQALRLGQLQQAQEILASMLSAAG
ncbi:MAG: 50S ribosome-binding GTPase, partial [Planctomycetaceae bacterium]|nr:50S ribosome-binding GTPase [Planctomycetaceae bacterium]